MRFFRLVLLLHTVLVKETTQWDLINELTPSVGAPVAAVIRVGYNRLLKTLARFNSVQIKLAQFRAR